MYVLNFYKVFPRRDISAKLIVVEMSFLFKLKYYELIVKLKYYELTVKLKYYELIVKLKYYELTVIVLEVNDQICLEIANIKQNFQTHEMKIMLK